jgi:K+-transporting ATPase ATPase C chain
MTSFLSSLRIVIATMAICVAGYALLILGVGQILTPWTANGWLIQDTGGRVVGSEQIAQSFSQPGYFWPRPSAVDYNGAGAGGSNKSPTNSDLTERATETVAGYGATADRPLPPDLAAASGGGLDPHISLDGAFYQVPRVAVARRLPEPEVRALVDRHAFSPGGPFTSTRIVNVLLLNRQLDAMAAQARP